MRIALLCFLLGVCVVASGQEQRVTVRGNARGYEGVELVFKYVSDYITGREDVAARLVVDSAGKFEGVLGVLETRQIFLDVGVYRCVLYVEPGCGYRIGLPPRRDKSEADRLNPFFEAEEVHLRNLDGDERSLNARIAHFDHYISVVLDSVLQQPDSMRRHAVTSQYVKQIKAFDSVGMSDYLRLYREYRLGLFLHLAGHQKVRSASMDYFRNRPIHYANPAYMQLFNVVYDRYFLFHGRTIEGSSIYEAIGLKRSYSALRESLEKTDNLGDGPLLELVVLKGIHDEFFSMNFSRRALLQILDSVLQQTTEPEHALIANGIRERVTKLMPGFMPRRIALDDVTGKEVTLEMFRGKLVLLCFGTTVSYTCIQDYALLAHLQRRYGNRLQVISICADPDMETMRQFAEYSQYTWPFLFYGKQPEVIDDFDVRAYPTYYLLDTDGRLLYAPAPSPQENLDALLHDLFRRRGWTTNSRERTGV